MLYTSTHFQFYLHLLAVLRHYFLCNYCTSDVMNSNWNANPSWTIGDVIYYTQTYPSASDIRPPSPGEPHKSSAGYHQSLSLILTFMGGMEMELLERNSAAATLCSLTEQNLGCNVVRPISKEFPDKSVRRVSINQKEITFLSLGCNGTIGPME